MYRTDEGLTAGPQLFADDNQLPLSMTKRKIVLELIKLIIFGNLSNLFLTVSTDKSFLKVKNLSLKKYLK